MTEAHENNDAVNLEVYKKIYLAHLKTMADKYDSISTLLTGRKIPHILLLHNNITSALFLDELIQQFNDDGWNLIHAGEVFKDGIYTVLPDYRYSKNGENFIDALARQDEKGELLKSAFKNYNHQTLEIKMKELGL